MTIAEKELALARRIAHKVGGRWTAVDIEDLTSELTLWLFENEEAVTRYRAEDGGEGKLFVSMRRFASKYCAREQAARTGAPIDHEAEYSVDQIERAMPFVYEATPQSTMAEDPTTGRAIGSSGYGGDYGLGLAILTDLKGAYADMPKEVQTVLTLRFREGFTYSDIASLTGCTKRTAIRRVQRALARMRDHVCGY